MAVFSADTDCIITYSKIIVELAEELHMLLNRIEVIASSDVMVGQYSVRIDEILRTLIKDAYNESANMHTMGGALKLIAERYCAAEEILLEKFGSKTLGIYSENLSYSGTDKRKWYQKFWDWILRKEPDDYDATSSEQEKAADAAMKKKLWTILQDKKYSTDNWDNSNIEERKQILQDYMNEVIAVYGLKNVRTRIDWDSNATYTQSNITWGYYNHGNHFVTLNERALTDSVGNWDSYDLLGTVSHELRHAYQHEAIDHPTDFMVSKETINIWKENFQNYIQPTDNYQKYRDQPVEVDARAFQISKDAEL